MSTNIDPNAPEPGEALSGHAADAAEAFLAAIAVVEQWLAAYRSMVERFRDSGTLTATEAEVALLAAREPTPDHFALLDRLDAIGKGEQP